MYSHVDIVRVQPALEVNWRKLETTLQNKHVDATKIDGADPEMKAVRSALWEISGKREYPLVFVWSDASDNFDCIGGADEIQLVSARTLLFCLLFCYLADSRALCPCAQRAAPGLRRSTTNWALG